MKKLAYLLSIVVSLPLALTVSCEDDLNLVPQDELSEATIFSNYNNIRIYAWSFYAFFDTYGRSTQWKATQDLSADLMQNGGSSVNPDYINQTFDVPANGANSVYRISYENIRKVNIMLDRLDGADLSDTDRAHWRGVGLFLGRMSSLICCAPMAG